MDIFEQWKIIEQEKFNHSPIKKEDIMEAIYQKSTSTMETLKTRLKYKMGWVLLFTICFIALFIWQINNLPVAIIFGAATIIYTFAFLGLRTYYAKMGAEKKELSTMEVLKSNYSLIKGALSFESKMMYPIFPFMFIGGMILPKLIDGGSISYFLTQPKFLITTIIALIVIVPLLKIMGDRMNKYAYGSYITKLEDNIKEMEMVD